MTEQLRIGVGYFKSSPRHRAIPSNYPLLQFSWAHCFSYVLHPRDSLSMHFRETALMLPITVFLSFVIRVLFFPLLDYFFHSSDEHLVFLCFIWLVFQEHHREMTFCASNFYLHFSFIHSSFHQIMQLDLFSARFYYIYWVWKSQFQRSCTFHSSGRSQVAIRVKEAADLTSCNADTLPKW